MSSLEQARSVLIQTIDAYNRGVSNCDPSGDAIIYIAIALGLLFLVVNDTRPFYQVFSQLVGVICCFWFMAWVLIVASRSGNTPHALYLSPTLAIRYGCAYDPTPIRINPLLEDREMFARIYQEAGNSQYDACTKTISLLKTMSIEYMIATTRNCSC